MIVRANISNGPFAPNDSLYMGGNDLFNTCREFVLVVSVLLPQVAFYLLFVIPTTLPKLIYFDRCSVSSDTQDIIINRLHKGSTNPGPLEVSARELIW